jgi:TonB family protein
LFLKTKSKVMNISFHFKIFLVLVSILFLVGQGQSQNCQVQLFEDKAIISYSSTMGKGSSIKYFMKDKVKNRWIEIKNVSGDAGLIVTQQKTYVGIWNHQQECQIKDIESIKVRIQSTDGTEEELLGQINQPSNTEPKVFDFAETKATYPGGEEAMYAELVRNLVYPELEKVNGIQGTVYVNFVVQADGSVSDIKILREVKDAPGFNRAAILAIASLSKRFYPATMNGNPVKLRMTVPIRFSLK